MRSFGEELTTLGFLRSQARPELSGIHRACSGSCKDRRLKPKRFANSA
jgi:hypothetical protein